MRKGNVRIGAGLLSTIVVVLVSVLLSACSQTNSNVVDELNEKAYSFHYKNLDLVTVYARQAYGASKNYSVGRAEALNNLAFVDILKMNFKRARQRLDSIPELTDNQVELLIADVQQMRLSQRESRNKDFYDFREQAKLRLRRIAEEEHLLDDHQRKRMLYARSEFNIVTSVYYYYVGLDGPFGKALQSIDAEELLKGDTAQYLKYLYNIGAGGVIKEQSQEEVNQKELDNLIRCYLLAQQNGYKYFEANSLQAISEHLQIAEYRDKLIDDNLPAFKYLNVDSMPDSLLAGNFAQRSLDLFTAFGDKYQVAGVYRTLATCYWNINDNTSAIICLESALNTNPEIVLAPDLVASIHEQLCVVYSSINDKQSSDFHRNAYLDLQEQTRQDRYLESRAGQLEKTSKTLNFMIMLIVILIAMVVLLLFIFHKMRKRRAKKHSLDELLKPLQLWQDQNKVSMAEMEEKYEDLQEDYQVELLHLVRNKERNLERRAKVELVNSVTPFIDRMLHEIKRLKAGNENETLRSERFQYINELTDKINEYNDVLTQWIQLKQGELSLHIESFPIQKIFDIVAKGKMGFHLKGVELDVQESPDVVKADRGLTLFMINTLADNARKFTEDGGKVTIASKEEAEYVEISVSDTGKGIPSETLEHIFEHKVIVDSRESESHGFGLMNCIGIINKYKKTSQIFSVCEIGATSEKGEGSRFFFRLPKGVCRCLLALLATAFPLSISASPDAQTEKTDSTSAQVFNNKDLQMADAYADSAFYSNVNGTYEKTLDFADTCRYYLNKYYLSLHPNGKNLMKRESTQTEIPAEIKWFHDDLSTNYMVILDIRNESAVAALALHEWSLYRYNNDVFTHLFKETSADKTLAEYCRQMQRSESNKNIAVALLIILLISIVPIYYFMYYRHQLFFRFCVEQLKRMNEILLGDKTAKEKKKEIAAIPTSKFPESLQDITNKINTALDDTIERVEESRLNIEFAEDNLHRLQYEDEKLHVGNNILDNCLSTLKHETMYYPSRIKQLTHCEENLQTIDELASYYKELYSLLSNQAMRQIASQKYVLRSVEIKDIISSRMKLEDETMGKTKVFGDTDLLKNLFLTLQRQASTGDLRVSVEDRYKGYATIRVHFQQNSLSGLESSQLFYPSAKTLPFLICKQIVREIGEHTNHRGCGISANIQNEKIVIDITLTKAN